MAKKVRFPLEMENGIEVRSMEELRNNFSLSRIIGYINDGKLVTWLQDRYESEAAEAIAEINLNLEDSAQKICEIFGVEYDDSAEEEVEKAEERKRKMELLKKYPESMEYSKLIDNVAFDQDDLYDLLDEDIETIYLCGPKFVIPVSKGNTKYVGITDDVEVVIDSKQIVDFTSKSIGFENCKFDAKYNALLELKNETSTDDEALEEEPDDAYSIGDIDLNEVNDFADNIRETIEEFANDEFENEDDELYEYDDSIECDADDYNDSGYSTKAKAACKAELTRAIAEVKDMYDDAKKELIEATETYYRGLTYSITAFFESVFYESCDALLDVYCTGETKKYIEGKIFELKKMVCSKDGNWEADITKKCKKAFDDAVKSTFDVEEKRIPSVRELFDTCEYEEEDEDDYSFDISVACESLVGAYSSIIQENESSFPDKVCEAYIEIINEYISLIYDWISDLEKTV